MTKFIIALCAVLFTTIADCNGSAFGDIFNPAKAFDKIGKFMQQIGSATASVVKDPEAAMNGFVDAVKKWNPMAQSDPVKPHESVDDQAPKTDETLATMTDEFKKMLAPLEQTQKQIQDLVEKFTAPNKQFLSDAIDDMFKATDRAEDSVNEAISQIQKLIDQHTGVNFSDCNQLTENIRKRAHAVIAKMVDCVCDRMISVTNTTGTIIKNIEFIATNLVRSVESSIHCAIDTPVSIIKCTRVSLINELLQLLTRIPEVGVKAAVLVVFVTTFLPMMAACVSMKAFNGFFRGMSPTVEETRQCIEGKIAESRSS